MDKDIDNLVLRYKEADGDIGRLATQLYKARVALAEIILVMPFGMPNPISPYTAYIFDLAMYGLGDRSAPERISYGLSDYSP